MKKIPWFETILIIVVMSISLYATFSDAQNFSRNWFVRDDAYYYFKVAQNISEGRGSTFDGINPTNGYHPLWMLVCVPIFALARFDLVLPLRLLLLVMSGLSAATGILMYRLVGKLFAPFVGALAALYWVFNTQLQNTIYKQGLESGIAAFFIVLLLYRLHHFESSWRKNGVSRKELIALGILASLTMFSRLDLVFLAALIGVWILFRGHPLRYYLPLDILSIIFSVLLAFTTKFGFPTYFEHDDSAAIMIVVALLVRLSTAYFLGLYQNQSTEKPLRLLTKLGGFALVSSVVTGILMLGIAQVLNFSAMPRTILVMDAVIASLLIGATRFLHRDLHISSNQPHTESPFDVLKSHWKQWLTEGSLYYGILAGSLGLYMLWNKFAIGSFSPVSGQVKRWWGSFLVSFYGKYPQSALHFFGVNSEKGSAAWMPLDGVFQSWADRIPFLNLNVDVRYITIVVAAALLTYFILRASRQKALNAIVRFGLIPLFVGSMLQVIYYNYTGYSAEKDWYWVGELIFLVLFVSILAGLLVEIIPPKPIRNIIPWCAVAVMGLALAVPFWNNVKLTMPYGYWSPDATYVDIIPEIEANTPPGSIIGMTGGGDTGYFIEGRTIVNMDGLINGPLYFDALKARTAGEFLEQMGVDYVLANKSILASQPYKNMFDAYLTDTGIEIGSYSLMKYGK